MQYVPICLPKRIKKSYFVDVVEISLKCFLLYKKGKPQQVVKNYVKMLNINEQRTNKITFFDITDGYFV